jgi:uncharacterized protein YkwD
MGITPYTYTKKGSFDMKNIRILKNFSIILSLLLLFTACSYNEKKALQAAIQNAELTTTSEEVTTIADDLLIDDKGAAEIPPVTTTIDEKGLGFDITTPLATPFEIGDKTEPPITTSPIVTEPPATDSDVANAILTLVNNYRAQNNLPALQLNDGLNQAAQIRAQELLQSFSHTRPDGRSFYSVLEDLNISYSYAAENVAYGLNQYSTAQEVFNGWINSEGHRANILSDKAKYLGVGLYTTSTDKGTYYYWAQEFAAF